MTCGCCIWLATFLTTVYFMLLVYSCNPLFKIPFVPPSRRARKASRRNISRNRHMKRQLSTTDLVRDGLRCRRNSSSCRVRSSHVSWLNGWSWHQCTPDRVRPRAPPLQMFSLASSDWWQTVAMIVTWNHCWLVQESPGWWQRLFTGHRRCR